MGGFPLFGNLLGGHGCIDLGLLVDLWVCVILYGIIELLDRKSRRQRASRRCFPLNLRLKFLQDLDRPT